MTADRDTVRAYALALGPVLDLVEQADPAAWWCPVRPGAASFGERARKRIARVAGPDWTDAGLDDGGDAGLVNGCYEGIGPLGGTSYAVHAVAALCVAAGAALGVEQARPDDALAFGVGYDWERARLLSLDNRRYRALQDVGAMVAMALDASGVARPAETWDAALADAKKSVGR